MKTGWRRLIKFSGLWLLLVGLVGAVFVAIPGDQGPLAFIGGIVAGATAFWLGRPFEFEP